MATTMKKQKRVFTPRTGQSTWHKIENVFTKMLKECLKN